MCLRVVREWLGRYGVGDLGGILVAVAPRARIGVRGLYLALLLALLALRLALLALRLALLRALQGGGGMQGGPSSLVWQEGLQASLVWQVGMWQRGLQASLVCQPCGLERRGC